MASTVIKIAYSAGATLTFDDLEVQTLEIVRHRYSETEILGDNSAIITVLGNWYRTFNFSLLSKSKTTLDNFETLRGLTEVLQIYPTYNLSSGLFYYAKVDPRSKRYFNVGGRDGEIPVVMSLIEYPSQLVGVIKQFNY
jgi:hypothetical protein